VGLESPLSQKLVFFGIILPKIPPKRFLPNLAWGGSPRSAPSCQISPLWLLKCELTAPKIENNDNFWYKFAPKGKLWASTEKVEYRCTTTNLPLCNDTIIVLKIIQCFIVFPLSQTSSFQSVRNKKNRQNTSHFFVYSWRATHDPHHNWHGDRGGPYLFLHPLTCFDPISSFATRSY